MRIKTLLAASALVVALPLAAQAQGTIPGAERGAATGEAIGHLEEPRYCGVWPSI